MNFDEITNVSENEIKHSVSLTYKDLNFTESDKPILKEIQSYKNDKHKTCQ